MSTPFQSPATGARSTSWFGERLHAVPVSLGSPGELLGEPEEPTLPVAELLEAAVVNASADGSDGAGAWKIEALLARLTPELLADMTCDASDDTRVTRQVPLSESQSVEVTVHRLPVGDGDDAEGWLFQQLWVAEF